MLDLEYLKKNPWQKFLYRAERFFRNIPSGFVSFFKKLWSVICGFGMKIAAAFQEVYRAAKDGDWKTRTSFVVMGFGHFARTVGAILADRFFKLRKTFDKKLRQCYYFLAFTWGCSSVGRALDLHSRGPRFESVHLHHTRKGHKKGVVAQLVRARA